MYDYLTGTDGLLEVKDSALTLQPLSEPVKYKIPDAVLFAPVQNVLDKYDVPYIVNTKYHITIQRSGCMPIDIWPTTKKFCIRGGKSKLGFLSLYKILNLDLSSFESN